MTMSLFESDEPPKEESKGTLQEEVTGPKEDHASFESRVAELQGIVQQMEGGSLGLDEAMKKFERGVELLRTCFQTLESAEKRIEVLTGFDVDGKARTRPFAADATSSGNGAK